MRNDRNYAVSIDNMPLEGEDDTSDTVKNSSIDNSIVDPVDAKNERNCSSKELSEEEIAATNAEVPHKAIDIGSGKENISFSPAKKKLILLQITLATALIPLTQSMVLPAMPQMQGDLHTLPTIINAAISISSFMYAVFPAIWATYGDGYGRRWIYIISLLISGLGNVGCALSINIPMLFAFRIVSAAGNASLLSMGAGTLADVFSSKERGRAFSLYGAVPFLVPTFAPTVGGAVVERFGWRGVYWTLAVANFATWFMLLVFLPETRPRSSCRCSQSFQHRLLTNPFASLKLLRYPNILIVSIVSGVLYFVANSIETSFAWIYSSQYGLDATIVGVCYLPSALGGVVGSLLTGFISDRQFKRNQATSQKTNAPYYPEMRLNIPTLLGAIFFTAAGYTAYGWLVQKNVSFAFGMIAVFFGRFGALVLGCLMVIYSLDSFHKKGASVSACLNIFRNLIGAVGTLTALEIQKVVGAGGYGTICAGMAIVVSALLPVVILNAPKWKQMREKYE